MKYKTQYVPCCEEELEKALNNPPEPQKTKAEPVEGTDYWIQRRYRWVLNSWEPYQHGFIIVWEEVSN